MDAKLRLSPHGALADPMRIIKGARCNPVNGEVFLKPEAEKLD